MTSIKGINSVQISYLSTSLQTSGRSQSEIIFTVRRWKCDLKEKKKTNIRHKKNMCVLNLSQCKIVYWFLEHCDKFQHIS